MNEAEQIIHVVDDDEAMRDSMTWLLEGEGYAVACYESAESFLARRHPAMRGCIVLDVRMPQMSGLELHERLEALGSRLPIIFVTGHGDVPMAVSALQRGACDFIEKPFNNEDLLQRIHRALVGNDDEHAAATQLGGDVGQCVGVVLLVDVEKNQVERPGALGELVDGLGHVIAHQVAHTQRVQVPPRLLRKPLVPDDVVHLAAAVFAHRAADAQRLHAGRGTLSRHHR